VSEDASEVEKEGLGGGTTSANEKGGPPQYLKEKGLPHLLSQRKNRGGGREKQSERKAPLRGQPHKRKGGAKPREGNGGVQVPGKKVNERNVLICQRVAFLQRFDKEGGAAVNLIHSPEEKEN